MASQMLWGQYVSMVVPVIRQLRAQLSSATKSPARLAQGHPVAWILGAALRTSPLAFAGATRVSPQAGRDGGGSVEGAGILAPSAKSTPPKFTSRSPGSEPMVGEHRILPAGELETHRAGRLRSAVDYR